MRHFVHGSDGKKYGPADLDLLLEWREDGRIAPETLLEPEVGGPPFEARNLAELFPQPQEPVRMEPTERGYAEYPTPPVQPVAPDQTKSLATATWLLGGCSVLFCPLLLAPAAIVCAVLARTKGHPQGNVLVVYAVLCGVLGFGLAVLSYNLMKQFGFPN